MKVSNFWGRCRRIKIYCAYLHYFCALRTIVYISLENDNVLSIHRFFGIFYSHTSRPNQSYASELIRKKPLRLEFMLCKPSMNMPFASIYEWHPFQRAKKRKELKFIKKSEQHIIFYNSCFAYCQGDQSKFLIYPFLFASVMPRR